MQGFIILATIRIEKHTLVFHLMQNPDKVNGAGNVGQGYQVKVCACRVSQGL